MVRQQNEDKRRVLQGYKQRGKRFTPPLLELLSPQESSWIDDRIPEVVWIALLMRNLGIKRGNDTATAIAQAAAECSQIGKAFAAASDYIELDDENKQQVRAALDSKGLLGPAQTALATLISIYDGFPLAFLGCPNNDDGNATQPALGDLEATIEAIFDRESRKAIFVQATAVHIYFTNGLLKVASGVSLGNLNAIMEYPETEESQRVAASVRSSVTFLIGKEIDSDWASSFWRQGRVLTPCEVVDYGGA